MDSYLCWSKDNISSFRDLLTNSYHTLETMTNDLNNSTIEHSIKAFTKYIQNHAFCEFGKTRTINKHVSQEQHDNTHKRWFNSECLCARKQYNIHRNVFLRNKTSENKELFLNA